MSTATMTGEQIADRLQIDPSQLQRFVEFHPNPDVDDVLGLADAPADELAVDREAVARWIDAARERPNPEDTPGATMRVDGEERGFQYDLWFDHGGHDDTDDDSSAKTRDH